MFTAETFYCDYLRRHINSPCPFHSICLNRFNCLWKALDISSNLHNFLSLSRNPTTQKSNKKRKKNVFPKQTPRNGFDETVSFLKLMFLNLFLRFWVIYFVLFLCFWFDWCELGWWVITRWRWSMMACTSSMWISMDLKTVNPPYPYRFFFSFDFQSDLNVSLREVELFFFSLLPFFSWIWLILYFNCVDHVKICCWVFYLPLIWIDIQ